MNKFWLSVGLYILVLTSAFSASNFFCPGGNQTISLGMSEAQVASACGKPMAKQRSQRAATEKVPVRQLIYNEAGSPKAFYGVWQISQGHDHGSELVVSTISNKIVQIQLNGNATNASSVCNDGSFTVGDPISRVYAACGNPSAINNTFVRRPIKGVKNPEIWIYQFGQYQSPLRLRFVGGKLAAIEGGNE